MSLSHGIQADIQYQMVDQLQQSIWQADLQISPGPMDPVPHDPIRNMYMVVATHHHGFHLLFKCMPNGLIGQF